MLKGVAKVQMRRQRGGLVVQAIGQTGRGVKYIVKQEEIDSTSTRDPDFKNKQTAAVDKLLGSAE